MQSCGDYQRHHRYQRHLLHHRTFTFLFSRSQSDLQDRVLTQVPKIKVAAWRWSVVTTSFRNSYMRCVLYLVLPLRTSLNKSYHASECWHAHYKTSHARINSTLRWLAHTKETWDWPVLYSMSKCFARDSH